MSNGEDEREPGPRLRAVPAEHLAQRIDEARAEGRPRNALVLQFLSEAASPDAFGLSAIGTERTDGLEWLSIQFVQTHPGDRHEIVSLILRPVIRDGLLYIEASRFDKENDPSGNRAPEWEGELKRLNSAELQRLRGQW